MCCCSYSVTATASALPFSLRVFSFETIKPGSVPGPDGKPMAPHVNLWIVARGINIGLNTRMYFPEEEVANAADPILSRIEHRSRVPTLIAQRDGSVDPHADEDAHGHGHADH